MMSDKANANFIMGCCYIGLKSENEAKIYQNHLNEIVIEYFGEKSIY
jgi:hypothetical protein